MARVKSIDVVFTNGDRFCYEAKNSHEEKALRSIYESLQLLQSGHYSITSLVCGSFVSQNGRMYSYSGKMDEIMYLLADILTSVCIEDERATMALSDTMIAAIVMLDEKLKIKAEAEQKSDPLK